MRQRIKRRLFMLSMAVAAGSAGPACAKGDGKAGDGLHPLALGLLGPHAASGTAADPGAVDKGWRLELLPPETKLHFDRDTSPTESKRFGLALRLAF